jgi:hypothetical protein
MIVMKKRLLVTLALLCLGACSVTDEQGQEKNRDDQPIKISTSSATSEKGNLTSNAIAKKAKQQILDYEEINEVIAVHHNMELIVGFNVKKLQEFNVKKIENKVKKELDEDFPNEVITVSHDRKILLELEKLIKEDSLSDKEIKKRLQKIKSLSKEKT